MNTKKIIKGKRPKIYDTSGMDHLMHMVMVLAQELSVTQDRLATLEGVLSKKGTVEPSALESYEPSIEELESKELRRQQFLANLFSVINQESAELANRDTKDRFDKVIKDLATQD